MAFTTTNITEVFPNATVTVGGDLTIPSGDINSYSPAVDDNVSEMIYGLLDTMAGAVSTGNMTNLTVTQTQTLTGDTLVKRYNFVVNLSYNSDTVDEILDVKAEPAE